MFVALGEAIIFTLWADQTRTDEFERQMGHGRFRSGHVDLADDEIQLQILELSNQLSSIIDFNDNHEHVSEALPRIQNLTLRIVWKADGTASCLWHN